MKCRYKEPMEYFYLTKDNYGKFLEKFFNLSCDDYTVIYDDKDYLKFKLKDENDDFNYYYLYNHYYILECSENKMLVMIRYTKEEFEKIFEVID